MELTGNVAGMLKLLGSGSEVEVTPILLVGTKIAEIKVDDTTYDIFAPDGGSGGSSVEVTPTLLTGTKIAEIEVDGVTKSLYAPTPGSVDFTQIQATGTKIATIDINGASTDIYAPTPTSVSVSQVETTGTKIATITINGDSTDLYAPSGGSGGGVNYSTNEIKIGTYTENGVDYDLYEKTYNLTLSSYVTQVSLADLGIRKLIHVDGIIFNNSDEIIMPFYENNSYNGRTKFNRGNNMLQIILSNDTFSYYKDAIYNIFYTKNS